MQCTICGADALFVCGRSGRPVCAEHARIEVVSRLSFGSSDSLSVREATPEDYSRIKQLAEYFKGKTKVSSLDKEYDLLSLPAYVADSNGNIAGVLSYAIEPEVLVIVMLDVLPGYQGLGAGSMLIERLIEKASSEKKKEVLVSTPNDDLPTIYFYQKNGFQIYDVKPNFIAKDNEVQVGFAGIPRRDEIRLRRQL
ncbi:MAG: GNAT family N-acetyltransferase [Armatimonadetes bacterium]|nr:GNAT family N-acetyltransferase [Armatimonadota bacterium]